jgi:hypothetical protein
MLCQLRTVGAGIAVLALCFMLASLSWQFLLLSFALASVAWACWSCSVQINQAVRGDQPSRRQRPLDEFGEVAPPADFGPRRRRVRGNIYAFPGSDVSNQGSGY